MPIGLGLDLSFRFFVSESQLVYVMVSFHVFVSFLVIVVGLVVTNSAINCLKRFVSKMTDCVLSGTSIMLTHSQLVIL